MFRKDNKAKATAAPKTPPKNSQKAEGTTSTATPNVIPLSGLDSDDDDGGLGAYTKRRRELLEILNSLHSTGVQNELDLPQIAVVGSQSVGKSSLIESMSGITLPRDSGTCTRCPMECRFQSSPTWSCQISLRFLYDARGNLLDEVREDLFGPMLFNKKEVEQTIRRAQKTVLQSYTFDARSQAFPLDDTPGTPSLNKPELSFSRNCVCINVTGPNVPDMYFYDLPGIIANVRDGEDEADIKAVEDIAKAYISRPNTLVLLVISCETDFENQGAGRLVLRDPELRNRTIGVLTKTDRIEAGTAPKWVAMLTNKENQLKNGWFAVKQPNPSELESGISWQIARANEDTFFTSQEPWASLDRSFRRRLGSVHLAEHLSTILSDLVSEKLPEIQKDLGRLLRQVNIDLAGLPVVEHDDPRKVVVSMVHDFIKKVSKHIGGLPPSSYSEALDDSGLVYTLNGAYDRFRVAVHKTAPRFRPWESTYAPVRTMQREGRRHSIEALESPVSPVSELSEPPAVGHRAYPLVARAYSPPPPRAPSPERPTPRKGSSRKAPQSFFQAPTPLAPSNKRVGMTLQQMIDSASRDDAPDGKGPELYVDQVLDLAQRSRTRELPGNFPFAVKENLIKDTIRPWGTLARSCFDEAKAIFNSQIHSMVTEHFQMYMHGGFLMEIENIVQQQLRLRIESASEKIETLWSIEETPFTQNEHYFFAYREKLIQRYRMLFRESRGKQSLAQFLDDFDAEHYSSDDERAEDIRIIISKLARRGIHAEASDLGKLLPSDPMDPAIEIMAEVRAYFQVAYKRFADVIPQLIDTDFIRKFESCLAVALMYMDTSPEKCVRWLEESPIEAQKRKELVGKKRRLELAREKLEDYSRSKL